MDYGALATRLTVALALILATLALVSPRHARVFWSLACLAFLAHVACAFEFFHHWSHAAAYRETARQTAERTGMSWGGGIYLNYLFALVWVGDAAWWWVAPASFARRPIMLQRLWRGFFFFMVLNGAIIFGHGPVRWLGLALGVFLATVWWRARARLSIHVSPPT